MDINVILGLLGGLALFLYGMQMTSSGLEATAGNKMKQILERLTSNRFMGVAVGALITALIQSSSATTVMVVGFVNAGLMTLNQAVWIIMGANIGTTITGILVSMDMGAVAPLFAFIGVAMIVFIKKIRIQHIGQILAGLGILFIGMEMMGDAMRPLRDSPEFIELVSTFSNPVLGILAGAGFTGLIQSSAGAIGIVQSLADVGVIPFANAAFVLFGTNIGTCITAFLASFGTSRNAKRAMLMHLMFNVIGTVIFTLLVVCLPVTELIQSLISSPKGQIAAMHTSFNIGTTLMLLPLGNYLAKLAMVILPEHGDEGQEEDETVMHLAYLKPIPAGGKGGGLGVSAVVIDQMRSELNRMLAFARDNIEDAFEAVRTRDIDMLDKVAQREEYIDFLNKEISRYVSRLISIESNEADSAVVSSFFTISGNIERIGDHADNLSGYTRMLVAKNIDFSDNAQSELVQMKQACLAAMDTLLSSVASEPEMLSKVARHEQKIDDLTDDFRRGQLERMRSGLCNQEACIIYAELLTDFERIGDHALNIAEEMSKAHMIIAR